MDQNTATNSGKPNEHNDTSSFFDILSRIQSNRLDDQRCSFRLVTNVNSEKSKKNN